jgi:tetratricopeptide (TPR) repeat protein
MRSAIEHTVGFGFAAKVVLLVEFALAATIWYRPGWWVALPMGVALHAGIVWSGLEIGLFAWLMLVLYLLLVPDRVFAWGASKLQPLRRLTAQVAMPSAQRRAIAAIGVGLCVAIAAITRYPHALLAAAIGASLVTVANLVDGRQRYQATVITLLAPALAAVLWLGVDRTTTTMYDYYRFWAGSESRIGDPARAKALYREVTERFPNEENGYYQLAKLEIASGSTDDKQQAVAHLQRAQQLAPHLARAFIAEAKLLLSQGDRAAALTKAQAGAAAEPTSVDALTLVKQLQAMAPGTPSAPGTAAPTMPGKRPILDTDDDR